MTKAADPSLMQVIPDMDYVPAPVSRRPFRQIPNCVVIVDADGKPVSCVQNAPWFFHVDRCHDQLTTALRELTVLCSIIAKHADYSDATIADLLSEPVAALRMAGVKVAI